MRREVVQVWSVYGYSTGRRVTIRQALEMVGENLFGEPVEGQYPIARRLSRKKARLSDIQLTAPLCNEKPSACTLKMADMIANAEGSASPKLRKRSHFTDGSLNEQRIGNHIDRAMSKVEEWPHSHDTRNTVISAGVAYGVFCIWPQPLEG